MNDYEFLHCAVFAQIKSYLPSTITIAVHKTQFFSINLLKEAAEQIKFRNVFKTLNNCLYICEKVDVDAQK